MARKESTATIMPALPNPRHERFAQLIFLQLCNGEQKPYSTSRAYIAVGYTAKDPGRPGSAQAASSRLLYRVINRVKELQEQAAEHTKEDATKIIRELNEVRTQAMNKEAYNAVVSAIMGKAKVLGLEGKPQPNPQDWNSAQSMQDIGRKLLQSVGLPNPSDADIALAIKANDEFVAGLERIYARARGEIIDQ
jgi:hypothetical protein